MKNGMRKFKNYQKELISCIDRNEIWSLIPARAGSIRVKNKNLSKIDNHELILYSLACSMNINKINRTFVTTDSSVISEKVKSFGAESPFIRSKKISGKLSNDYSYFYEFIEKIYKKEKKLPYLFIQLRPTTPFRNISVIELAIKKFISQSDKYDSLRSSSISSHPPEKLFRIKNDEYVDIDMKKIRNEKSNKPSQYFLPSYKPNGYIDIIKTENIIKKNNLYGRKILPLITGETIEIDINSDLEYARNLSSSVIKEKLIKFINEKKK